MQNDPELNGKYLGTITKDFAVISDTLKEASYQIRKRQISEYPIFIFSKQAVPIGSTLIGRGEMDLQWHVSVSYLELFLQQKLVTEDRQQEFIANYKNPDEFCCLFVADNNFTNFIFIPFPED